MLKREITATLASNGFGFIMAIGSSAIIARILQPEGRGLLGLALLLPLTAAMFCNLGQSTVNATYAGLYKDRRIQLFQQSLLIAVFSAAFTSLLLFAFFFWLPIPKGRFGKLGTDLIYLSFIIAPVNTLSMNISSLVRGVGRIITAAKIRVFQSISLVVLLAIFLLWLRHGVKTALLIIAGEQLFAVLASLWVLRDYISVRPSHFSLRFFQKSLSFGFKCSIATLAGYLVYRLDQGILAYMVSKYQIGLYFVAVALAEKIPAILILYGRNYLGTIPSFLVLLPGIATLGGSGILSSYLASHNKPKYGIWTGWTTLAVNVTLNFAWIPLMGIAGAALASTVSYTLAGVLWLLFYRKESKVPFSEMIPKKEDFRYLWQQFIILFRYTLQRLRKNKPADVTETKGR